MGVMPIMGRSLRTYGVGTMSVDPSQRANRNFNPGKVPIARAQAALGIGAALIGLAGVLLPHPSEFDEAGLVAIQIGSLALAALLLGFAGQVPNFALRALPFLAIAMTTLAIFFTRDATSAYALFYLWPSLYAFYFLSRTDVARDNRVRGRELRGGDRLGRQPGSQAGRLGGRTTSSSSRARSMVAGALLLYLRSRVERLMGRLSEARADRPADRPAQCSSGTRHADDRARAARAGANRR